MKGKRFLHSAEIQIFSSVEMEDGFRLEKKNFQRHNEGNFMTTQHIWKVWPRRFFVIHRIKFLTMFISVWQFRKTLRWNYVKY